MGCVTGGVSTTEDCNAEAVCTTSTTTTTTTGNCDAADNETIVPIGAKTSGGWDTGPSPGGILWQAIDEGVATSDDSTAYIAHDSKSSNDDPCKVITVAACEGVPATCTIKARINGNGLILGGGSTYVYVRLDSADGPLTSTASFHIATYGVWASYSESVTVIGADYLWAVVDPATGYPWFEIDFSDATDNINIWVSAVEAALTY